MTKTDTNVRVEIIRTNKSLLNTAEISNGCVYFVEDTKELFFDFDSKRSEVKDILILEKESERTSILFAPLNKFYFVLETKILWLYKDGSWYQVSQSGTPGTTPSSISISDLSKISTGLSISSVDNKVAVSSGHVVDSTATKVLKLESPMNKTLSPFAEGNGNGGMSSLSGDLIPALTSNSDTGLIYGSGTTGDYVQPYFVFDKNESTNFYCQIFNGINDSQSSYVGYEFSSVKPAGNYSIKYITKNGSSSGTTELELYILTTEGNKELVYQNTNIDTSWQTISASINISKPFTTIYVANDSRSYLTRVAEFYIYAESSNIHNINIIAKDDDTTDICIGDDIPSGFTYSKQIGKITLNEDCTQIVDFLPKTDLATLYANEELALKSDIPTDYVTKDDIKTVVNITYSELVDLKANNQLETGVYYRITDYVTTTNGNSADSAEPSRSAGHPFDIIIQAIGPSNLYEIGTCALHEGDTYFAKQNLSAWQVWYDINNDTSKYGWAVTDGTGKGVIYRMIDEYKNDFPYDFKNIQFYRDKTLEKYSILSSSMNAEDGYYYTVTDTGNNCSDLSLSNGYIYDNQMGAFYNDSNNNRIQELNNVVSIQYYSSSSRKGFNGNKIAQNCYNNTFGSQILNNNIGIKTYNNVIGFNFTLNTIDGYFRNNTIGTFFYGNHIAGYFQNNKIGDYCRYNTVNTYCDGNTFGNQINWNNISGGCMYNVIGDNLMACNIGAYFKNNTHIGTTNAPSRCNFGAKFENNTIGNQIVSVTFENDIKFINIPEKLCLTTVKSKLQGSSETNLLDLTGIPTEAIYSQIIEKDINGRVLVTYNDLGITKGKYKESVTATDWNDINTTIQIENWEE